MCVCVYSRSCQERDGNSKWVNKATIDSDTSSLWKPTTESADPGGAAGGAITPLSRKGWAKEDGLRRELPLGPTE